MVLEPVGTFLALENSSPPVDNMASDKDRDVVGATDTHHETEPAEKTLPEDATPNSVADERAESPMQKPTTAPPPPPNGGLLAWSQVAGAFFLYFNTWYAASAGLC